MNVQQVYYMLMVEDMDRAVAFYRDVVGLEVRSTSSRWSELAYGDATVALHGGGTGARNKTGLGFTVSDIDAACREAADGSATVLRAPEERPGEPIKLAGLVDTEGNEISFTQYIG